MRLRSRSLSLVVAALATVGLSTIPAAAIGQVVTFDGRSEYLSPPFQYLGGGGSFGFTSLFCEEGSPVGQCSLASEGTYTNIVCGTGSADGAAYIQPTPGFANFHITFVAGIGLMTGGATGLLAIVPTLTGPRSDCVDTFTLAGIFST